jgi:SagB-type dehydrogenase family enzyme
VSDQRPWTADEVAEALEAARRRLEDERRAEFRAFGIPESCLWPASRLFHEHSSLGPAWAPIFTVEEAESFTRELDYKRYPGAERAALPRSGPLSGDLEEAIRARRSNRVFTAESVSLAEIGKLLELSCGVTEPDEIPRRAAPSGGALYPVETYVVALRVNGLRPGIWHYVPVDHVLEHVRRVDGIDVLRPFLPPGLVEGAPTLMLALSAVFARTQMKYLERGYRFALLEAGHVAQNIVLVATALGLASVCVGGFWDEPFNDFLELEPAEEAVVYSVLLGSAV